MTATPPPRTDDVAVVIAAYQASASIGAAVRSALAEPEVSEVWVVDDASADGTAAEALRQDDGSGRLHVLTQAVNRGPAAARNRALALVHATWVCVLDADDHFLPGRIGRMLSAGGEAELIADLPLRDGAAPTEVCPPLQVVDLEQFIRANISRPGRSRQEMGFIKPLMRCDFLAEHSLTYDEELRLGEDYDLYARALALGARLHLLPPMGYFATTRADSLSGRHGIADLERLRDCDLRLARLRRLSPSEGRAVRAHYQSLDARVQWRRLIEAVKARDVAGGLATFTSPAVAAHLIGQLAEQAWLRTWKRASAGTPARPPGSEILQTRPDA
ncbi:MAG: glycosyltransferase family 2 protein [Brevundimonas sp.]